MRRSHRALAGIAAIALFFAYRTASSAPPASSATPTGAGAGAGAGTGTVTATGTATATVTATGSPDKPAPAPLPAVASVSWPEETSKPPSLDEWKTAEELSARGGGASTCRIRRVREWVRVRCLEGETIEIEQVAGPQVHTLGVEVPPNAYANIGSGGTVFSVRRGDRRVVQWLTPRNTSVVEVESGVVLTEQWLPEDPGPMITIDQVEKNREPVTGY
jgi:hypothetical protein